MITMQIRDAQETDVPAILAIYNHAIRTSTATFDLKEHTLEQRLEWFSHYGGNYPLIVAVVDGKVAGYSCLSLFRTKPAYAKTAEISVYIDEKYQGRGIGKALMKEILERAQTLHYHTIIAGITAGNEVSVKLHEKFGFTLAGHFKEVGYKFGAWQDVLFYQLLLFR
jgi:L-amino acid N-acyltransferase YncA